MFANLLENVLLRWECGLEWYLLKVDTLSGQADQKFKSFSAKFITFSEHPETSSKLLKMTVSGLIITFAVLLFSCQTPPPRPTGGIVQPRRFDAAKPERELDQLYLKRDEFVIKNRESGSGTGSIWADAQEPRTLLADPSPNKEGQTVTINIPTELQFDPKSVTITDNKKGKDKKSSDKSNKEKDEAADGLKLTDPDDASPTLQVAQAPLKSIKMQIVGFEPGGDVYLRGTRRFTNANGEENMTMILAKVPRRAMTGYEIDARELTDVAINEDLGGRQKEYSAPGWDEMISRRLAGFSPDLKSEMGAIDGLRDEIRTAQNALREQAKANEMERERIRKERDRMAAQAAQSAAGSSPNPATAATGAAPDTSSGGKP